MSAPCNEDESMDEVAEDRPDVHFDVPPPHLVSLLDEDVETTCSSDGVTQNTKTNTVAVKRDVSEMSCDSMASFEVFDASVNVNDLPIIVFTDDVGEQRVWTRGSVKCGRVRRPQGRPDICAVDPIVMSPAYLGFAVEPYEQRYLHFKGVGMVFARPLGGKFMQPSIDTILVCSGLAKLFDADAPQIKRAIDIGSGSGFLGKFVAAHAPGTRDLSVTLVDIDPAALEFSRSAEFHAASTGFAGRPVTWTHETGDAVALLQIDSAYDLLVSNPPYIPTVDEVLNEKCLNIRSNFWEGTGLVVYLIELITSGKCREGAHLVLALTSLTLTSPRVRAALETAEGKGVQVRILVEREIGWKAWYAGRGQLNYLLAKHDQFKTKERVGACEFYVGATETRRTESEGGRNSFGGYHWHVAYVLDLHRPL